MSGRDRTPGQAVCDMYAKYIGKEKKEIVSECKAQSMGAKPGRPRSLKSNNKLL